MKLSTSITAAVLALTLISGSAARASISPPGTVYGITVATNGIVYFWQRSVRVQPACSAGMPGRWVFNSATPGGQSLLALILSANASGKSVIVAGTGTCDVSSDTESALYVVVDD